MPSKYSQAGGSIFASVEFLYPPAFRIPFQESITCDAEVEIISQP